MNKFKEIFNRIINKRNVMVSLGLSVLTTMVFGFSMVILTQNKLWIIYVYIISFILLMILLSNAEMEELK